MDKRGNGSKRASELSHLHRIVCRICWMKKLRMLTSHKVFSKAELESRCEIMLENYCKTIVIEANTMVDMAKREIIPAVEAYVMELAKTISLKKSVNEMLACQYENSLIKRLSSLTDQMAFQTDALENALIENSGCGDIEEQACGSGILSIIQNAGLELSVMKQNCYSKEILAIPSVWRSVF